MLSVYLIIIASGLAAAGLSFLTWVILLLSLGSNAITANVIAAVGLTYFLLHFLVLTLLRLNLRTFLQAARANSGLHPSPTPSWITITRAISSVLKRSPALRKATWALLAATAIFLLLERNSANNPAPSPAAKS